MTKPTVGAKTAVTLALLLRCGMIRREELKLALDRSRWRLPDCRPARAALQGR